MKVYKDKENVYGGIDEKGGFNFFETQAKAKKYIPKHITQKKRRSEKCI